LQDQAAVTGFISNIMVVPISIFIGQFISDNACCHHLLVSMRIQRSLLIYLSDKSQYKPKQKVISEMHQGERIDFNLSHFTFCRWKC
jgi:hypothetical protein